MSISSMIVYDESRLLDAEWWSAVAVTLAKEHRFSLHFYQGDESTWTKVTDWERIRVPRPAVDGRIPTCVDGSSSFFYLRDRPGSNQAALGCIHKVHQYSDDPRFESAPYSLTWPDGIGKRLRKLRGNLELDFLYLDDEPFDFCNAVAQVFTARLDGFLYAGDVLTNSKGLEHRPH